MSDKIRLEVQEYNEDNYAVQMVIPREIYEKATAILHVFLNLFDDVVKTDGIALKKLGEQDSHCLCLLIPKRRGFSE
jgi:hypothetical protein